MPRRSKARTTHSIRITSPTRFPRRKSPDRKHARALCIPLRASRVTKVSMSKIALVDPELRDALAQGLLLPPLTAETLMQRAPVRWLVAAVPIPNLPDIATDEIHVESAFGAKPIRVLTYRPVTS